MATTYASSTPPSPPRRSAFNNPSIDVQSIYTSNSPLPELILPITLSLTKWHSNTSSIFATSPFVYHQPLTRENEMLLIPQRRSIPQSTSWSIVSSQLISYGIIGEYIHCLMSAFMRRYTNINIEEENHYSSNEMKRSFNLCKQNMMHAIDVDNISSHIHTLQNVGSLHVSKDRIVIVTNHKASHRGNEGMMNEGEGVLLSFIQLNTSNSMKRQLNAQMINQINDKQIFHTFNCATIDSVTCSTVLPTPHDSIGISNEYIKTSKLQKKNLNTKHNSGYTVPTTDISYIRRRPMGFSFSPNYSITSTLAITFSDNTIELWGIQYISSAFELKHQPTFIDSSRGFGVNEDSPKCRRLHIFHLHSVVRYCEFNSSGDLLCIICGNQVYVLPIDCECIEEYELPRSLICGYGVMKSDIVNATWVDDKSIAFLCGDGCLSILVGNVMGRWSCFARYRMKGLDEELVRGTCMVYNPHSNFLYIHVTPELIYLLEYIESVNEKHCIEISPYVLKFPAKKVEVYEGHFVWKMEGIYQFAIDTHGGGKYVAVINDKRSCVKIYDHGWLSWNLKAVDIRASFVCTLAPPEVKGVSPVYVSFLPVERQSNCSIVIVQWELDDVHTSDDHTNICTCLYILPPLHRESYGSYYEGTAFEGSGMERSDLMCKRQQRVECTRAMNTLSFIPRAASSFFEFCMKSLHKLKTSAPLHLLDEQSTQNKTSTLHSDVNHVSQPLFDSHQRGGTNTLMNATPMMGVSTNIDNGIPLKTSYKSNILTNKPMTSTLETDAFISSQISFNNFRNNTPFKPRFTADYNPFTQNRVGKTSLTNHSNPFDMNEDKVVYRNRFNVLEEEENMRLNLRQREMGGFRE